MAAPVTTVFTPPASCSSATSSWSLSPLYYGWNSDCRPSSPGEPSTLGHPYYYSPAICPSGYFSACSLEKTLTSSGVKEITLASGEYGHKCCPSGYSCLIDDTAPYYCRTSVSPSLIVPFWNASSLGGDYHFVSSTVASQTRVTALAIVVKYRPEDVSLFPASVATTLIGSPTTMSTTPTPTAPHTTTAPPTATGKVGISQGTKIAIGVAVPIAILSLVAVIAIIFFFRRRSHRPAAAAPAPVVQYIVAPTPVSPPQSPPPQGKPGYHFQPSGSPPQVPSSTFQQVPAPGYHEMGHGQGLGYQVMRQDGVRDY